MARQKRPNRCDKTVDMFPTGEQLKAEGMAAAMQAEAEEWKADYLHLAMEYFAGLPEFAEFTGEQMNMHVIHKIGPPHHPNVKSAMFSAFLRAMRTQGALVETDLTVKSRRPARHANRVPVYMKT